MQFTIDSLHIRVKMKNIFFGLLLSLCLTSCDIPGKIYIKNRSGTDASFLIQKTDPEDNLSISRLSSGDDFYFPFGFGNFWTDERVIEFVSDIEKLEIQTKADTIMISDKSQLISFFKDRRGNFFNSEVKIIIK